MGALISMGNSSADYCEDSVLHRLAYLALCSIRYLGIHQQHRVLAQAAVGLMEQVTILVLEKNIFQ